MTEGYRQNLQEAPRPARHVTRAAVLGLAVLLALAGCIRPGSEAPPEEDLVAAAFDSQAPAAAASAPTTGSLLVTAVFSDRTPLAGVKLELGNVSRSTDGAGVARFEELEPGTYTLVATKAAHRAAQQQVTIEAGSEAAAEVVLAAEEGGQHAHAVGFEDHEDVYVFEGHFDCTATYVIITGDCMILVENVSSTTGLPDPASGTTSEKNIIDFPLDVNWSLLVVEMAWEEPTPPTAEGMTLALEPAEAPADGHAAKYARAAGGSPLRIELRPGEKHETATAEDMPNPLGGEVLRARAFLKGYAHNPAGTTFLGVGAAQGFQFTLTVTVTYGDA